MLTFSLTLTIVAQDGGYCNEESMDQVIKFQKKAARLILDKDHGVSSKCLLKELKWVIFYERIHNKNSILMYQTIHNTAPRPTKLSLCIKPHTIFDLLKSYILSVISYAL